MSTKLAHPAPVVIVATIAAAVSISIATANPAGAEPHQIPVYTGHQRITDPNKIFPGQVINIPKHKTYVVRRGDTFSGIAKKFGISLAALEAANGVGVHRK
jgi:LysM repeat protein